MPKKRRVDYLEGVKKASRMVAVLIQSIEKRGEPPDEAIMKEAWMKATELVAILFRADQELAKKHERNDAETLRRELGL